MLNYIFRVSFSGIVILSAYKAMLSASMAIVIDQPPVHSLEDIKHSSKMLSVWSGTEMERKFTNAKPGTVEYEIWKDNLLLRVNFSEQHNFLKKYVNGLVPNTILFTWRHHAMMINPNNDVEKPYPCRLKDVKKDFEKFSTGLLYAKHWPYTKAFNYHMLKLQEDGTLDHMTKKYIKQNKHPSCVGSRGAPRADMLDTFTAFVILAACGNFAVLIFVIELLINVNKN